MKQLNFKSYVIAFLCFAGMIANAQDTGGTQEICIGDIETYSVTENPGSSYDWYVVENAFEGLITDTTASGNGIQIDWQTTPVGSYTLTVIETNAENCPGDPVSITVNVNPLPDAPEVALTQPGCGEEFGSAEVTSPLGADLQYSIDGGTTYQSSVTFEDLAPGNYEVIAQNASGCVSEPTEFEILEPLVIPETPAVTLINPQCGETTGSLEITAPTGTGLQYSIDGGTTFSTDLVYTDLAPGDYTVIVTNGDCESEPATYTINPAPEVPEDPISTVIHPDCGELEGTITVTTPTGTDVEYSADGGVTWQDDPEFTLTAGTYQIQVRNTTSLCTSGIVEETINEAPPTPVTSPIQFN
ncbi:hypothetical protein ACFQ0R_02340 [Psychroflexus salinarum]|uniref:SprB repeat-containing protein n=1 Tax=Psychroflexus salinarum TaxID=546024 RepID=A0ABW3GMK1_9FLAO